MSITRVLFRSALILGVGCLCAFWLVKGRAASPPASAPPIIEAGFDLWTKGGSVESVFNLWQKGGALDGDSKIAAQAAYVRRVAQVAGNYQLHEVLQSRPIGHTSQVLYLEISFERAAVYARILLYHTQKEWVVQNLDFSTRPEDLMPWLALDGDRSTQ